MQGRGHGWLGHRSKPVNYGFLISLGDELVNAHQLDVFIDVFGGCSDNESEPKLK